MAYWSVALSEGNQGRAEIYMKKFIYFFIIDLGISPFVKCYQGKTLIEACIDARRIDTLKELLSHTYIVHNTEDKNLLRKSGKNKDINGNNALHRIFSIPEENIR